MCFAGLNCGCLQWEKGPQMQSVSGRCPERMVAGKVSATEESDGDRRIQRQRLLLENSVVGLM